MGGVEGNYNPIDTQKNLAHFSIDNGADLIIGHHPHVVEGLELYNNKIICYSLGNFNPRDKDTFIFQIKYAFKNDDINDRKIRIIPCKISSVNNINDYCPTPVENDEKERILTKINGLSKNLPENLNNDFININVKK
ncbi:CapA family protein [Clostridium sp. Marseille-Q2269]|uniref:CapA family protein n=1 Tax=Clostridium sp. Marseille-Q2269 TaxID=2942205 RepID=UPI00336587F9